MVEEELKPEYEIMSNLKRTIEESRQTLNRVEEDKDKLIGITKILKEDLNSESFLNWVMNDGHFKNLNKTYAELRCENKVLRIEIDKIKNKETSITFDDNACLKCNPGSVVSCFFQNKFYGDSKLVFQFTAPHTINAQR